MEQWAPSQKAIDVVDLPSIPSSLPMFSRPLVLYLKLLLNGVGVGAAFFFTTTTTTWSAVRRQKKKKRLDTKKKPLLPLISLKVQWNIRIEFSTEWRRHWRVSLSRRKQSPKESGVGAHRLGDISIVSLYSTGLCVCVCVSPPGCWAWFRHSIAWQLLIIQCANA